MRAAAERSIRSTVGRGSTGDIGSEVRVSCTRRRPRLKEKEKRLHYRRRWQRQRLLWGSSEGGKNSDTKRGAGEGSHSTSATKVMLRSTAPQRRLESAVPTLGGGIGGGGSNGGEADSATNYENIVSIGDDDRGGRNFTLFDLPITPDVCAIALVYFVQGIVGLSTLAIAFFLKDDLSLDPTEVGLLTAMSTAPWLVKPLYGFISDSVPIMGYRRRSYLFLCGLLGAAGWTSMALVAETPIQVAFSLVAASGAIAIADVVVDSIVVEKSRHQGKSTEGSLQSLSWGSRAVGAIVSAYFSGSLVQLYGPRFVFGLTAFLPLILSVVALIIGEEKISAAVLRGLSPGEGLRNTLSKQGKLLWGAISQESIWLPAFFVFTWQATPNASTAMLFFQTNQLGFDAELLGRINLATSFASLVGVALYNYGLKNIELKRVFFWTCLAGVGLGLTQLVLISGANRAIGISDTVFATCDSVAITVLGQVAFMPVLVLSARICPPGVEATLFATLMSILNSGGLTSNFIGAYLTRAFGVTSDNFDNLAMLIIVTNLSSLLPLPLLWYLPKELSESKDKM